MNIIWHQNPLRTRIELDENEKRYFRLLIKVEELEDRISSAHFELSPEARKWSIEFKRNDGSLEHAIEMAQRELRSATDEGQKVLENRVDLLFEHYVEALIDEHAGDCTCFPCSCTKCHAESLLSIDTIEGLGKHPGSRVSCMFQPAEPSGNEVTIDEVIEKLRDYVPVNRNPDKWLEADFQQHVPRWIMEAKHTREWLINYKATKLGDV